MAVWTKKCILWRFILCSLLIVGTLALCSQGVSAEDQDIPSESQCRPYIEKALKDLESGDAHSAESDSKEVDQTEGEPADEDSSVEILTEDLPATDSGEVQDEPSVEIADEPYVDEVEVMSDDSKEEQAQGDEASSSSDSSTEEGDSKEGGEELEGDNDASAEDTQPEDGETNEDTSAETKEDDGEDSADDNKSGESSEKSEDEETGRTKREIQEDDSKEEQDTKEDTSAEQTDGSVESASKESDDSGEKGDSKEETDSADSKEETDKSEETDGKEESSKEDTEEAGDGKENESVEQQDEPVEETVEKEEASEVNAEEASEEKEGDSEADAQEEMPENDLLMEIDIPENLRSREHISQLLRLDEESTEAEMTIEKSADITLRELKKLYDGAIKPLEILYKYRDLSNRHFGDPEIFSKPLVLFMGPWSGGKSSLVNYLTDNEFTEWSLRTGAEPSPAYFNILMHGPEPAVLDGTQLAADWTFSGLQKFGQGLEERLRGLRLPNKLLEKVNIVEIPGILEVRKQVSRVFPFNDACQWFIDRADVIFLVYDPSKLDVGPETEAILDQLKGREAQTRIILNKADQVKPEELMRVQSALIWNISPLMSSAQPPVMYTTSLWSLPYEAGAPARLLQAQERSFLRDLRTAIDRRVENKIASARRFAVRVRNHAKMVDCYLTTYYNHKTIFGNKKVVAEAIIEHPQNYHIYEGLSTLTNISRYDLPDPETYRDFFRLNPLFEFQQLSATCTYFRGCPINRLDVAIAYDLPELVGKYKKMVETSTPQGMPQS